jgi:hypothetical protein
MRVLYGNLLKILPSSNSSNFFLMQNIGAAKKEGMPYQQEGAIREMNGRKAGSANGRRRRPQK